MPRPIVNTPTAVKLAEKASIKPPTPQSENARNAVRKRQEVVELAQELADLLDTALLYWPSGGHLWRQKAVVARDLARQLKGSD